MKLKQRQSAAIKNGIGRIEEGLSHQRELASEALTIAPLLVRGRGRCDPVKLPLRSELIRALDGSHRRWTSAAGRNARFLRDFHDCRCQSGLAQSLRVHYNVFLCMDRDGDPFLGRQSVQVGVSIFWTLRFFISSVRRWFFSKFTDGFHSGLLYHCEF